jgi:DNA-binding XRE family transcriptional regulator
MPRLKEARIQAFMSVRDLALAADCAVRTIVEAESGRRQPQASTMRRIAKALEMPPADIDEFREAMLQKLEKAGKAAA